jgi:hypothetical protein
MPRRRGIRAQTAAGFPILDTPKNALNMRNVKRPRRIYGMAVKVWEDDGLWRWSVGFDQETTLLLADGRQMAVGAVVGHCETEDVAWEQVTQAAIKIGRRRRDDDGNLYLERLGPAEA